MFIFPDLNTGNTTYKAVQRNANCLSVGPMLQGLAKPVNDLSRGALVDDIVFTIALTPCRPLTRRADRPDDGCRRACASAAAIATTLDSCSSAHNRYSWRLESAVSMRISC